MSSRCSAISSKVASGSTTPARDACARISACQSNRDVISASGWTQPGKLRQGCDKAAPVVALDGERLAALVGDAIAAPPPLPRTLDPPAAHEVALLEAIERRIQRGEREPERPLRSPLDPAGDFIAVQRLVLDEREDHEIGTPLFCSVNGAGIERCHI